MMALHLPMADNHSNLMNYVTLEKYKKKNMCNGNKRKTVCINITVHVLQLQRVIT